MTVAARNQDHDDCTTIAHRPFVCFLWVAFVLDLDFRSSLVSCVPIIQSGWESDSQFAPVAPFSLTNSQPGERANIPNPLAHECPLTLIGGRGDPPAIMSPESTGNPDLPVPCRQINTNLSFRSYADYGEGEVVVGTASTLSHGLGSPRGRLA